MANKTVCELYTSSALVTTRIWLHVAEYGYMLQRLETVLQPHSESALREERAEGKSSQWVGSSSSLGHAPCEEVKVALA